MKKTLVIFAHPYLEYSFSNRVMINFYERHQHYDFLDLYEEYPDFYIPAFKERKRLQNYERFILHFPLIWFGLPPLLRLYLDEVLDPTWINTEILNPFEGKEVHILTTTRSKERSFGKEGKHGYSVEELISGLLLIFRAFEADIKPPYIVYEAESLTKKEIIEHKLIFSKTLDH